MFVKLTSIKLYNNKVTIVQVATREKAEIKREPIEPGTEPRERTMLGSSGAIIESFDVEGENLGPRWTLWVERLEQLFDVNDSGGDKDRQRLSSLFLFGGVRLHELQKTLPQAIPETARNVDTNYEKAVYRLTQYLNPRRNVVMEQFSFSQARQVKGETISQYVTRLRILATYCEFGTIEDKEIVRQVIQGCESTNLRRSFLKEPGLAINRLLDIGGVHDTIETHLDIVEGRDRGPCDSLGAIQHKEKSDGYKFRELKGNTKSYDKKMACFKCGYKYPHDRPCPALNKECKMCGKIGHFAAVCKENRKEP